MKYGHKRKRIDPDLSPPEKENKTTADITGKLITDAAQLSVTCQKVMYGIYAYRVILESKRTDIIVDEVPPFKRQELDGRIYQNCKDSDLDSDRERRGRALDELRELGLA